LHDFNGFHAAMAASFGQRENQMNTALRHLRGPLTGQRRLAIVDLVACIVLAICAGLATGVALMGAVLLLSGEARAEELAAMKPAEVRQGTLLLKSMLRGETLAVPVLDTEVEIRVAGPIARTRVRQTFRNPYDEWQEGIYVFPLPESAAVDHLKMRIGERVVEGEIKEKAAARAAFEQARQDGQRAALVEQERPNIFTTSVANISPRGEIVVEIEYQQSLRFDNGTYRLRFPMVVGPRYIPGTPDGSVGHGWAGNTDQVPDAGRITPPVPKVSPGGTPLNPVRLRVELDAGVPIADISSGYHAVKVTRGDDRHASVELASGTTPANRDFELAWQVAASNAPRSALLVEQAGDRHYGLLMVMPPVDTVAVPALPRETVFIIDTSGSMSGPSLEQAREALALAVARLKPTDRFNIIEFNSTAQALFADAVPAGEENLRQAAAFVRRLQPTGGTEMAAALNLALNGREDPRRVRQVIFLTDGAVGNEDALFALIDRKLGDSRFFTVGIGSAPNSWFMSKAARTGRGTFTYIGKIEEVREKMSDLFAKLESPVLKGVTVNWPAGVDAWPKRLPDLYLGEPLVVSVALDKPMQAVSVGGFMGSAQWQESVAARSAPAGSGLGVLWARRKIESLLDGMREGKTEDEVKPEVVAVALEHHLVSKYTSLVAVDKTPARPVDAALKGGAMPTNLPEGWNHAAVFGELPKGATDMRWHLLIGAAALLAAMLLRRRQFA
jgi:Ca-activated chloride channel family protein